MLEKQKKYWITNKVDTSTAEVLLYGYIDPYDVSAGDFVKELRSLEKEYSQINVRINSGGGSVFEGLAIYNAMKQSKADINTYIDGLAASMASIIALAGKKVCMSKMARIMTHQPSSGSYGNSEDLRKNADLLDGLEKTMCAIYAGKTGKTMDECKNAFMNGKDNWFDAQQAIDNKLVDEVYDMEGVEQPAQNASVETMWNNYQHQFAARFIQQNPNMKQYNLSAASMAALQIGDTADEATVNAKIADLAAKASQFEAMKTAKEKAENDLSQYKEEQEKAEAENLLNSAVSEKKMTVEMKNAFADQFKGNLAGLKAVLATLKPFESKLQPAASGSETELEKLSKKTYSELDRSGELPRLKELAPDVFKAKFKEHFKKDYQGA